MEFKAVEICAGAGGQALGLEQAGFQHQALVELDADCCSTLRLNRPEWNVEECDLRSFDGSPYYGIDLLAGGLPCPPFSIAGKQLGEADERNLFPEAIRLVREMHPKAVMIENVKGIFDSTFEKYRDYICEKIEGLGYRTEWRVLNSLDYGVPQSRIRSVFIAFRKDVKGEFAWPPTGSISQANVGDAIYDLMSSNGWSRAEEWKEKASRPAPTIVGGSKKHGGPDLGPTRAKKAWRSLGIDGNGIADTPPNADFNGFPRLTVRMVARLQGFPDKWIFSGRKTSSYRQVGNAFPPPVAAALASKIASSLKRSVDLVSVA